jgi:hypothetical protein
MALPDDIALEAAKAVRPYLPELMAAQQAVAADRALAAALAAPPEQGAAVAEAVLLRPELEAWTLAFATHGVPEDLVEADLLRGFRELPGAALPVRAPRYRCPDGDDYVWYRRSAGTAIPLCPTHSVRLVADPARA